MNEIVEYVDFELALNNIKKEIEACTTVQEAKQIRDKAEVLRQYAKSIKAGLESQNLMAEAKIRAERKIGNLIKENPNIHSGQPQKESLHDERILLGELGITEIQSHRWQKIASLNEKEYEDFIEEYKRLLKELTSKALLSLAKKKDRKQKIQEEVEKIQKGIDLPKGKYEVIIIDPPWPYGTEYSPDTRRAASPYPEMSLEQIANIPVDEWASENCILWLWTTHKFMRNSFPLIDKWGFREVAILTWVKDRMGLGDWLRSQSEFCIMAVKGKPKVNLTNQTTIIGGKLRQHSRKPDEFYELVKGLCIGRATDYFGREQREDFEVYGSSPEQFQKNVRKGKTV